MIIETCQLQYFLLLILNFPCGDELSIQSVTIHDIKSSFHHRKSLRVRTMQNYSTKMSKKLGTKLLGGPTCLHVIVGQDSPLSPGVGFKDS